MTAAVAQLRLFRSRAVANHPRRETHEDTTHTVTFHGMLPAARPEVLPAVSCPRWEEA